MTIRAATRADVPAVADLHRRHDTAWFGAPETDERETTERFDLVGDLSVNTRLVSDGDRLVAAAWRFSTEAGLVVDPDADAPTVHADLLGWLEGGHGERVSVLDRDTVLRDTLAGRGWTHRHSVFDLRRAFDDGWSLPAPTWADGVTVRDYAPDDAVALHRLIYDDARFADEPGHDLRPLEEWQRLFVMGRLPQELPLLACRGPRIVGTAIGRTHSDGTGWINQFAVAGSERGQGIGTAVMAAYFARQRDAGATAAGLAVMATNRDALRLYRSFGLEVVREHLLFAPPPTDSEGPATR
ncbi:GNAT family N-acetyltransferase [uncultured Jatrophihabitans sp.]|uniref:GNAT family N-acetyltransferase n=1 Tax=uncultured Jatrophihabitans sp. TaxID=1610747 RepID=UPI0035C9932B